MGKNAFATGIRRIWRTACCTEWGRRPVYSGRYKDQYNMDCCCMDARHGQSTGVGEFASGNGYESYGAIDDDKEY